MVGSQKKKRKIKAAGRASKLNNQVPIFGRSHGQAGPWHLCSYIQMMEEGIVQIVYTVYNHIELYCRELSA